MPTNPNKAFRNKKPKQMLGSMMTEGQRYVIEQMCIKHDISLIALTTRAIGFRKKTKELTVLDAARCIMMGSVWENYRRAGYEK